MAHMDRIRMGGMYGVHGIRFEARARAPDRIGLVPYTYFVK